MKSKIILLITLAFILLAYPILAMQELQIEFRGKTHELSEQAIEHVGFLNLNEFAKNFEFTDEHKVFELDTLLNATRPGTTEDEFTKHIELTKQGAKIIDWIIKLVEEDNDEEFEIWWSLNKHLLMRLQAKYLLTGNIEDEISDEEIEKDKIYKILRNFIHNLKQFNRKKLIVHIQLADVLNNKALLPFLEVLLEKIIKNKGKEYCLHGTGCVKNVFEKLPHTICRQAFNQLSSKTLPVRILAGHKDDVGSITKINDDQVISASSDKTLKLWNLETGRCLKTFKGHKNEVSSIAKINDDQVISASCDNTLKLWDLKTGKCLKTFRGHEHEVWFVKKINDHQVISASCDNTLKLWDLKTGKCLKTFKGHKRGVSSVAKVNDHQIMSSSWGNTLKLWDLNTAECLETYKRNPETYKKYSEIYTKYFGNHTCKIEDYLKLSELATSNFFQIFTEAKNEPWLKSDKSKIINDHQIIAPDGKTLKLLDLHWLKQLPLEQALFLKILKPNEKLCLAFYPHAYKTFCKLPKNKQEWALKNNLVYQKKLCLYPYSHAYKTFYQLPKNKQEWALKNNLVHLPVITRMWRFIKNSLVHSPVTKKVWRFIKNNVVHSAVVTEKAWNFVKDHRKKITGAGIGVAGTFSLLSASTLLKELNPNKEKIGFNSINPRLKHLVSRINDYNKRPCLP